MAPTNSKAKSQYADAKAGLASLAKQTGQVALFFLIFLLLTGGAPSPLLLSLGFCMGIGFVAWKEKQRLTKSDELTVLSNKKEKPRMRMPTNGSHIGVTVRLHEIAEHQKPVSEEERES